MGYKQALKHNGLSGRLPKAVKILKPITNKTYPYIKQEQDILKQEIVSPHPYGFDKSIGLPKSYPPIEQLVKPIKPVDLNEYIDEKLAKMIPNETQVYGDNAFLNQLRHKENQLKKKYFKEVLEKEESRMVEEYKYIKKLEEQEKKSDEASIDKFKNTLKIKKTIVLPTIENIKKFLPEDDKEAYPMVRQLTAEELEYEQVKEEVELLKNNKNKEIKKMDLLQDLVKQVNGFILNEHQLKAKIEQEFETGEETQFVDEDGNMKHADIMRDFSAIKEGRILDELDNNLFDYDKEESSVKFEHLVKYLKENK